MRPVFPYTEKSADGIPWHTTFIGQGMQHNFWLYAIVDKVMMENPQISSIIEIGTGAGALSSVFGLWGIKRGIPVLTIDSVMRHNPKILERLDVQYLQEDEFSDAVQERILEYINEKPTWVFCDGGNKKKEFQKFAPIIPKNSIISAHDLGVEFIYERDAASLVPNTVIPYREEWWQDLNIQLALFKKV